MASPSDTFIQFGKYRGRAVEELPSGYLRWMLETFSGSDWERHGDLYDAVEEEMAIRDRSYAHWEED